MMMTLHYLTKLQYLLHGLQVRLSVLIKRVTCSVRIDADK